MTLDELLLEWSYRSDKGYPSLDSPSDLSILKQILEQLDLPTNEIFKNLEEGTNLNPGELKKSASFGPFSGQPRAEILIKKIEKDEPLILIDGSTIVVNNKEEVIIALRDEIKKAIILKGKDGKITTTSKLKKTVDFGGKEAISSDEKAPTVDTDTKEALVIVMCNVLKEGGNLVPFDKEPYADNFKIINNSTNKFQDIEDKEKAKINQLFNLVGSSTNPLAKLRAVLNNPYSIAVDILKAYPNPRFNRGKIFNEIRTECSRITGLPKDKWNPGDIYLINSEPTLPTDTDSIVPWNELFVNNWGDTDRPLVSISLKEEKYQSGRAKSYLDKFGGKEIFNTSKTVLKAMTDDELKAGIKDYRNQVRKILLKDGFKIDYQGNGWDSFPNTNVRLKAKYGCYKLLSFLLSSDNEASLLGLFAYGLSIDQDLRANPTFFKLVGGNKGELTKKVKYPAGVNAIMAEDEDIVMTDNTTAGDIKITGVILKTDGDRFSEKEETSKTLRSSGEGQIQIT